MKFRYLLACILMFAHFFSVYGRTAWDGLELLQGESLYETISGKGKKQQWLNLYLDMHAGFDLDFNKGFQKGHFTMRELKLGVKGQVTSWLSYFYCQRLNRSMRGENYIDNVPASIDYALIGVKPMEGLTFNIGKQCAAFGGFEFDMPPIEVYAFSDMLEYMECYMTGVAAIWQVNPRHELQAQILNSYNKSAGETFGEAYASNPPKLPLLYALNWNGSIGNSFSTRWSVSAMNEVRGKWLYYMAFGNCLEFAKGNVYVDAMYSREGLDKTGVISSLVPVEKRMIGSQVGNVCDVHYFSLVSRLNYRFLPKWNMFVKGMYDVAGVYEASACVSDGKYRTAWGYLAGLEFFPMKQNFRFFLTYTGRSYIYNERVRESGMSDFHTHHVAMGFVYQLSIF